MARLVDGIVTDAEPGDDAAAREGFVQSARVGGDADDDVPGGMFFDGDGELSFRRRGRHAVEVGIGPEDGFGFAEFLIGY
jgi:hypothetical protein